MAPIFSNIEIGYNTNTTAEPRGIIAIKAENESATNLIISAILLGNSVLIFSKNPEQKKIGDSLVKVLISSGVPKDVATVFEYTDNRFKLLQMHKEVVKIFGNDGVPNLKTSMNIPKNYPIVTEWSHILNNVVVKKTVWSTIGQSII